jgi:hypothetical protein
MGLSGVGSYNIASANIWSAKTNVNNAELNSNININNPAIRGRNLENKELRGFNIQTHNIPEVLQFLAKKIQDDFKIKVLNSDDQFSEEELKVIYYTLGTIPKSHLKGVTTIVKNRSLQLGLQDAPTSVFAKMHKNRVYGAYDKDNKRIYIFELDKPEQASQVLKHEIGHAVHSHNLSLKDFFAFMLESGWKVAYHEQHYITGNSLYNIGLKKVEVPNNEAMELVGHFDWDSIRNKKDMYSKYVLSAPKHLENSYAYKNPFETFASIYEKTQ